MSKKKIFINSKISIWLFFIEYLDSEANLCCLVLLIFSVNWQHKNVKIFKKNFIPTDIFFCLGQNYHFFRRSHGFLFERISIKREADNHKIPKFQKDFCHIKIWLSGRTWRMIQFWNENFFFRLKQIEIKSFFWK